MKLAYYVFLVAFCLTAFCVNTSYATDLTSPTPTPLNLKLGIDDNSQLTTTPTPVFLASGPPPPTPTPTALYSHGREPTDDEWNRIKGWFPRLNRWEVRITDDDDYYRLKYNCHRWSIFHDRLDILDQFEIYNYAPPFTINEFMSYMAGKGYMPCSPDDEDVEIVAYKQWNDDYGEWEITHTEVVFSGNNNLMESKLGKYERITHPPGGLKALGDVPGYGNPSLGFKKTNP